VNRNFSYKDMRDLTPTDCLVRWDLVPAPYSTRCFSQKGKGGMMGKGYDDYGMGETEDVSVVRFVILHGWYFGFLFVALYRIIDAQIHVYVSHPHPICNITKYAMMYSPTMTATEKGKARVE
jgi:hypothetical protein